MFNRILVYGLIAGAIVGAPMFASVMILGENGPHGALGLVIGFSTMFLAFSMIFLGVKRQRDVVQGGVIKFLPAFLMGLGISVVASVIYVLVWELSLTASGLDYGRLYAEGMVEAAKAKGASEVEIAAATEQAEAFAKQYANRAYRMPLTFTEIFPVGVIVSLISALLLRNARFMPAQRA